MSVSDRHPASVVRRLTLNRPDKRNALSNDLRGEVFAALEAADGDAEVRVTILRGAGPASPPATTCRRLGAAPPYQSAAGAGQWARHVVEGCFRIWDLAKPVIAQVHGWCLAGGSELATACDLVYVAEDAQIGYPPVRMMSPPDNQFHAWLCGLRPAMEMMLTGDAIDGLEAVRVGFANRAFPADVGARGARHRRTHRQDPDRRAADEQALRASRHGDHGPARGHPRRHRDPGARLSDRAEQGLHDPLRATAPASRSC